MLLLVALLVGSVSAWGADETIDFSTKGYSNGAEVTTVSGTDFSVTFNKGTNNNAPKYYSNSVTVPAVRVYGGGYFTVTSATKVITKIELTFGTGDSGDSSNKISTDVVTYSDGTWTGEASSVKFTVGGSSGHRRIASVAVTYKNDNRTAVNLTSFTATKTTLLKGDEVATSVSNDQVGWTAAYTYSSDDEDVATIDTDGKITAVAKGSTTVRATLNVDNDDPDYKTGSTYTRSINITVNNPSHNVVFSVNGVAGDPTSVEEGDDIVFPSDPASVGGKTFVGWVDTPIDGSTDDEPTLVTSAAMGASDVTYYAVFATSVPGITTITDELNRATTGISSTDYGTWSGKTENSDAVYAGQSAGGNNSIQLRSANNNSGIITTTSGGKAKKVTVDWNSNTTAGRTLDIYGKNTAYTAATDLYDIDKRGTKLGSIVCGTSTELTITGDYTYIGVRSNNGAMYLNSISIDWETEGYIYASYCTTIPATVPVTISDAKYATFASDYDLDFSGVDGLYAYTATVADNKITFNRVTKAKAGEGLLLYADVAENTPFNIPITSSNPEAVSGNKLVRGTGAAVASTYDEGATYNYVLSNNGGEVNFYRAAGKTVGTNKAYLKNIPEGVAGAKFFLPTGEEETDGIRSIENSELRIENSNYYNLSGQRVGKDYKGIVIVNGKKMLNK